jgi:hypothetical protein
MKGHVCPWDGLRSVKPGPPFPVIVLINCHNLNPPTIIDVTRMDVDSDDDRAYGQMVSGPSDNRPQSSTSATNMVIDPLLPTATFNLKIAKGTKGKTPRMPKNASSGTFGPKRRVTAPRTKQAASTTANDETRWHVVEPPPYARKRWTVDEGNASKHVPQVLAEVRLVFDRISYEAKFVSNRIGPSSWPSFQN